MTDLPTDPECACVGEGALDLIDAAAQALPPPQRAEFRQLVVSHLASMPMGTLGPGCLHRAIAACQKQILDSGLLAVGPSPKHGRPEARRVKAQARRA